jgi:hypothetical protein
MEHPLSREEMGRCHGGTDPRIPPMPPPDPPPAAMAMGEELVNGGG